MGDEQRGRKETEEELQQMTLRLEYSKLLDEAYALHNENNPGLESVKMITEIACRTENLLGKVRKVDVALYDAKVVKKYSQLLQETVGTMDFKMISYNPMQFAQHIVNFSQDQRQDGEEEDHEDDEVEVSSGPKWHCHTLFAKRIFKRRSAPFMVLRGIFDMEPIAPPQRKKGHRVRQAEGITRQPEKIITTGTEDDVDVAVQYIFRVLNTAWRKNDKRPIFLFKFILNPDSFAETCQNLFHLGFLVKDLYVDLTYDNDGCPYVSPVPQETAQKRKEDPNFNRGEMVISFKMEDWREFVKEMDITEPMIKPRK